MFSVGDEVAFIGAADGFDSHWPFSKGTKFVVRGVYPIGSVLGDATVVDFPSISIGVENRWLRSAVSSVGAFIPHYDLWVANRFRKIERKHAREELHALIGISDMLGQRAPELV